MAKVYESDIDPDEFIRSFREESSSLSSLKKKPPADGNAAAPSENAAPSTEADRCVITDEEYLEKFVFNMAYMRPRSRFLMVEVDPDFIRKIKRIISYETGPVCSVKGYVNNVLAEHFSTYEKIIKKRL